MVVCYVFVVVTSQLGSLSSAPNSTSLSDPLVAEIPCASDSLYWACSWTGQDRLYLKVGEKG